MAYILGFLYADGNIIRPKRGGYYVAFHTMDEQLLSGIRAAIKSTHKLAQRSARSGKVFRLQIGSKILFEDLVRLGLTQGKARRMRFPKVPRMCLRHFIRGYFDGDGNVWMGFGHRRQKRPTRVLQAAFTSCSHEFLIELLNRMHEVGIEGGSVFRLKKKNASRLILGTSDSLKLAESMYNGPHKLYLPRKKAIFEQFVHMRE